MRGIELSADDLARRAIIQSLMCHFELSTQSIEIAYLLDFESYFRQELEDLKLYEAEGLVDIERGWIGVTPKGRLLIRNICMVFDRPIPGRRGPGALLEIDINKAAQGKERGCPRAAPTFWCEATSWGTVR